jgi:N-acetylmuramic acid 6-phosphate etherase
MNILNNLTTEQVNSRTVDLDAMPILKALEVMNDEDSKVTEAVREQLPNIEKAIVAVIESFRKGGRLIYIGAGTSGRLGLLDAVECPPTFGTPPSMVVGLLAGGVGAFAQAVEYAEDSTTLGVEDLRSIGLTADDMVIGIAASGRTPYVVSALKYASELGCKTAAIACTKPSLIGEVADIAIEVVVGPEVLTGSTRLKAGTAQKMVLNMISTLSMVGIGKVYKNLMVDVQLTNQKLRSRAENIIMSATGADRETADKMLQAANGSVKLAIVMILLDKDAATASKILDSVDGHIRKAIQIRDGEVSH